MVDYRKIRKVSTALKALFGAVLVSGLLTVPAFAALIGPTLPNSVNSFNADFTPASSGTAPTTPTPDTTAPTIDLTTPGSKSTYRRLTKVSLTTEPGAKVKMAFLKCIGSKCTASAKAAKKSKKKNKCRALVKKKAKKGKKKKKKTYFYFGGKKGSCSFGKVKSKYRHSISLSSSGKGSFKLAEKLRGKKNKKRKSKKSK